ncbi:uncharacterized protein LOC128740204 [Sabethes cyaneus]|uniref:uncharacterized protein LOC128740204 n=1 Tax=Sabethes cyaneus TaxID=53552 RepID=UPI00237DC3F9|nr:uncharacterized protein LOC128740204 [Sabethes cyaneus]
MLQFAAIVKLFQSFSLIPIKLSNTRYFHNNIFISETHVRKLNDILKFSSATLTVIVTLVEKWAYRNSQMQIWSNLRRIANDLVNLTVFNKTRRRFSCKFWMCFVVQIVVELRIASGILIYPQWTRFWCYNIYPATFCRMLHMCHILYIDHLTECIIIIRENLLDIKNEIGLCVVLAPIIMFTMLTSAHRCSTLSADLGVLLHKIPEHHEWELQKIVYFFSLQISQQPIRLSAYTLMNFNYPLTIRIFTGIATYMMIFAQIYI